jgi:ketosteroid isomerase-like protein
MSEENVEIVRESIARYNAEDLEAALGYLHQDIEWYTNLEWPEAHCFRGYDGVKKLAALLEEAVGNVQIEPDRFVDSGDHVIVLGRLRVTGVGSGAATESFRAWVYTLRDRRIIRHLTFTDEAEAFKAITSDQGAQTGV